jgi:mannose-6-phosphate isomerase-like protein (cupin superfamily)
MSLDEEESEVTAGDCVVIPPGTRHKLWAAPDTDLVLLCSCSPAYRDDDTELTEPAPAVGD